MTRIFIEAKHEKTSESVFIHTLLKYIGKDSKSFEVIHVDGKDNLKNNKVKFQENTLTGGRNLVVFDADTPESGWGYEATKKRILSTFSDDVKIDDMFLYPNNQDDGVFENLLERLMQKEKHSRFFDCFTDYENCLGDEYVSPDLKGKLHTYMSAQKSLSNKERKNLGSGQWLFDDERFWNLDSEDLKPLREFFMSNI